MDELNEQLSAMVDNELQPRETRLLVRQIGRLPALMQRISRYHLIRAALHGTLPRSAQDDLAARVALALEAEPAFSSGRQRRGAWTSFAGPVAGLGIAVSVALVAVSLWPQPDGGDPVASLESGFGSPGLAPIRDLGLAAPVALGPEGHPYEADGSSAPLSPRRWDRLDPRVRQQLSTYVVDHREYMADDRSDGAITHMRIAVQDGE